MLMLTLLIGIFVSYFSKVCVGFMPFTKNTKKLFGDVRVHYAGDLNGRPYFLPVKKEFL